MCTGRTPLFGLKKNSKSITISTTADKREIPKGLQKMAICQTPTVKEPPPVSVLVSRVHITVLLYSVFLYCSFSGHKKI